MSMQQVSEAELNGWGRPVFPEALRQVAEAFTARSSIGMSGAHLEAAARSCDGFVAAQPYEVTSDGYSWYRLLRFSVAGGSVVIAIPMTRDTSMRDGTRLDRSPAAYARGAAGEEGAATIADDLARAMRAVNERQAAR